MKDENPRDLAKRFVRDSWYIDGGLEFNKSHFTREEALAIAKEIQKRFG